MNKLFKWATSRQGIHDIGAVCGAIAVLIKGLQSAGVI